jgi:hypothetical protein
MTPGWMMSASSRNPNLSDDFGGVGFSSHSRHLRSELGSSESALYDNRS